MTGIGASFGFHQSPLLSVASSHYGIGAFLWITSELSSVYLRETLRSCKFCLNFVSTSVLVANCTFLHKLLMLNISFSCCRHSVFNICVQLTEGRSARDQPKQLRSDRSLVSNLLGLVHARERIRSRQSVCLRATKATFYNGGATKRFYYESTKNAGKINKVLRTRAK